MRTVLPRIGLAVCLVVLTQSLGGWWSIWCYPFIPTLVFGLFPQWRRWCSVLMKDHANVVLQIALFLASIGLIGLAVVGDVLPAYPSQFASVLGEPVIRGLVVIAYAVWGVVGALVMMVASEESNWWRPAAQVLGGTVALASPLLLGVLADAVLRLALRLS